MRTPAAARAFTLVEIMIVVAIIGILLAVALPGFIKARERARQSACQENLSKLDQAIQQYILEKAMLGEDDLDAAWSGDWAAYLCGEESYVRSTPECPSGGTYKVSYADDYEPVWCTMGTRDPVSYPHRAVYVIADENAPAAKP